MRAIAGQAARVCGSCVHHVIQLAAACLVVVALAVGALAWRLSSGPLDVAWIARKLEAAATGDGPRRLTIGSAALAWEGWSEGVDRPLDLRLTDIAALDTGGRRVATLPRAELSVSTGWLLLGRIVPRAIEIDGATLAVTRAADGAVSVDLGGLMATAPAGVGTGAPIAAGQPGDAAAANGGLSAILREMAKPPQTDRSAAASRWAQLRRARIRAATIDVVDHRIDATWAAKGVEIDLRRRAQGGIEGDGDVPLVLGDTTLHLIAHAVPTGDGAQSTVSAMLTPFTPADLARHAPGLAALSAVDLPVTLRAEARLDGWVRLRGVDAHLALGGGRVHVATGQMPIIDALADASLAADGTVTATLRKLEVAERPDGARTTVTAQFSAHRDGPGYAGDATVDLDQAAFADLSAIWPEGTGGRGTRPWITSNVTAGTARNLHVAMKLAIPADFSDADLVSISGGMDGRDLTVHWLRPVPPIIHADGRLNFVNPQTIDVAVTAGQQAGGKNGGIVITRGLVHITGIENKDQFADIDGDLNGPLADLIALLKHPKIRLLDKRPIPMENPSGKFAGHLRVANLPFKNDMSLDDLAIHATTRLTDVHLGGIVAGRDLDGGVVALDASNDGLTLKGTARISGVPAKLDVAMDFRGGPPSEVLTKVHATATVDAKQLAAAGLDPAGIVAGPVSLDVGYQERRDATADATLHADLARTAVTIARAGISKTAGAPATADLHASLDHGRLTSIDRVRVVGDGILVEGSADMAGRRPNVLRLQRVKLGTTTDVHGEIRLPAKDGDAYGVTIDGTSLDLSREFDDKPEQPATAAHDDARGPAFVVEAKLDRLIMGQNRTVLDAIAHVDDDGLILRRANIAGRTGERGAFKLAIEPSGKGRRLSASAEDAGALLRVLDVTPNIVGGRLTLSGNYDDTRSDHPLSGQANIAAFRFRDAPGLGKVLQAMTLYGLVDALSGPGLNFDRLTAPFRYSDRVLELSDARAFSSSLGMTAKGRIDVPHQTVDITGTVVPAYFFNSLLGRIPFIGRVFSAEREGGLFAVNYWIRGPFADPAVGVNPLSALTPGFLRGLFDLSDATPSTGVTQSHDGGGGRN